MTERPELADVHCHFVPDVDDGAATVDQALHYLERGLEGGVSRVAATPHLPASRARSPLRLRIEEHFRELDEAVRRELPELTLSLAFEIRLDGAALDPDDEGLWLGPGGHVLVEYDRFQVPADPLAPLTPLLDAGRVPVLAHPERYRGAGEVTEWAQPLRQAGVKLCPNAGSLTGRYGPGPKRLAARLLARGQADLLASDHHARPDRSYALGEAWELFSDWGEQDAGRRMLAENPAAALEGRDLMSAPRVGAPEMQEDGSREAGGRRRPGRAFPSPSAGGRESG